MTLESRGNRLWQISPTPPESYFTRMGGFPPIVAHVLYNRGIRTPEEAHVFLDPVLATGKTASLLNEFRPAVDRLARALEAGETIAIYGDFDADGVTSAAILTKGLRAIGAKLIPYIPDRVSEGHGLNKDAVQLLKDAGANLIVTADCGVTDVGEVALAADLNVDVIITDHHTPPARLPEAVAIVNPKMPGQPANYRELASCGVAYKLIEALYEHLSKDLDDALLGMAALGTIADMALLTEANRSLVHYGLGALNRTNDVGLRALIEVAGLGAGQVDSQAVSFSLAPRLNAPGRIDHAEASFKLLTTESDTEAKELAKVLDEKNVARRTETAAIMDKVLERQDECQSRPIIILGDPDFPPGVVGLAAGRLAEQYYRPAIVCTVGAKETRGSCRSIPEFNMIEALRQLDGIFDRYGGHDQAAGFTIATDCLPEFTDRMTAIASEQLADIELSPRLDIDVEVSLDRIDGETIKMLRKIEPYGQGNRPPTLLSRGVDIVEARPMGAKGDHLRLKIKTGRVTWNAVCFNAALSAEAARGKLDLVFSLRVDRFGSYETLQLEALDVAPHSAAAQASLAK